MSRRPCRRPVRSADVPTTDHSPITDLAEEPTVPSTEYADAVRATARDLDAVEPGWYRPDRVDLDRLDMASLCDCLLGQVFGYYSIGLDRLAAHRTDVAQEDMFGGRYVHEHVAATGGTVSAESWRREVLARRGADARAAVQLRVFAAVVVPDDREFVAQTVTA